jgi:hypothetical protein
MVALRLNNNVMKKVLFLVVFAAVAAGVYWFFVRPSPSPKAPKTPPIQVKQHSPAFNAQVDRLLALYMNLGDCIGAIDTAEAKSTATELINLCDQFPLQEFEKDTTHIGGTIRVQLSDIRANAQSLILQTQLEEMRQDYRMVSESLYPFLKTIAYTGQPLNWYFTVDPFGPGTEANWLGWRGKEIRNPYFGKMHPTLGDKFWSQGEIKDSIIAR